MRATNIDQVLEQLDGIIDRALVEDDKVGYFAALYRIVTREVKKGIEDGFFDDGERMDRLDTIFANRYLDAYHQWYEGKRPTKAWRIAFRNLKNDELVVLQHLLLSMNAHINLDLGIAVAEVMEGKPLEGIHGDYNKINDILHSLLDPVEDKIGDFSPLIHVLDKIGGRTDEVIANFSLKTARDSAWFHATHLNRIEKSKWNDVISHMDMTAGFLGKILAAPTGILGKSIELIRMTEEKDVPKVIHILGEID